MFIISFTLLNGSKLYLDFTCELPVLLISTPLNDLGGFFFGPVAVDFGKLSSGDSF